MSNPWTEDIETYGPAYPIVEGIKYNRIHVQWNNYNFIQQYLKLVILSYGGLLDGQDQYTPLEARIEYYDDRSYPFRNEGHYFLSFLIPEHRYESFMQALKIYNDLFYE